VKKIAFTIVLNGMPFIKDQGEILPYLFDEWHIIEGATLPIKDTAWCKNIDNKFYTNKKLSVDGTTEYIDKLAKKHSNIIIHRKENGDFWQGKLEMCQQVESSMEDCILMQFDVDEIWNPITLKNVLDYATTSLTQDGMLFKCNYFVGPGLVIQNENCYGNKNDEWCRLWKIKQKTTWKSHEPPRINGLHHFLSRDFTKQHGWIFNHYAYVKEDQVAFKENFYGYPNAVMHWRNLQNCNDLPTFLRNFLPWVNDNAIVDMHKIDE
jgi:hypothetical protein